MGQNCSFPVLFLLYVSLRLHEGEPVSGWAHDPFQLKFYGHVAAAGRKN